MKTKSLRIKLRDAVQLRTEKARAAAVISAIEDHIREFDFSSRAEYGGYIDEIHAFGDGSVDEWDDEIVYTGHVEVDEMVQTGCANCEVTNERNATLVVRISAEDGEIMDTEVSSFSSSDHEHVNGDYL